MSTRKYVFTGETSNNKVPTKRKNPTELPRVLRSVAPGVETLCDDDILVEEETAAATTVTTKKKKNDKPERLKQSEAQATSMTGRNIIFEEFYDSFKHDDPVEMQKKFAPPFMPQIEKDDVRAMIEWERNVAEKQLQLAENKYYQFLAEVAGYTRTKKIEEIGTQTASDLYRNYTPSSNIGYSVSDIKDNTVPTQVDDGIGGKVTYRESENDRIERRKKMNQRQATQWIEQPMVMGSLELTPKAYAGIQNAILMIHNWYPDTLGRITPQKLIESEDTDVNSAFAQLVANSINGISLKVPTRNNLQINYIQTDRDREMLLQLFSKFQVDSNGNVKSNNSAGRSYDQRTSTLMAKVNGYYLPPL